MKSVIKGAIIFVAGAGLGSGITFVTMREKFRKIANDEIASMKEFYDDEYRELDKERKTLKDKEKTDEIIREEGYVSYDQMSREEVNERVRTIQEAAIKNEHPTDDYPEAPFVIDEPAFSEDELYFEKVQADYYVDDGALVDENEEMLNIDDCIGLENLDRFLSDDTTGVIYIRNTKLATDYEVTKVGGKYSDILGVGVDDDDD